MTPTDPPPRPFDNRYGYVIACLPFVVLGILAVIAPTSWTRSPQPACDVRPACGRGPPWGRPRLGRPGFVVIWAASSRIGVLVAELFFTLPALFTIILTAPVVLILQRLGHI